MPVDAIDKQILSSLQLDARIPYAELGRQVGLTAPAITERIRKLEASGILTGYHATVDLGKAGMKLVAFVRITAPTELGSQLQTIAAESPEILEFHRVTGTEGFVLKVAVPSVEGLEKLIVRLLPFGQTTTSIVLSSPVTWREIAF